MSKNAVTSVEMNNFGALDAGEGLVLCVDGMDGAGKSTFVDNLFNRLTDAGKKVYVQHFPRYDEPLGQSIKKLLHSGSRIPLERPDIMQRLYVADQIEFEEDELPRLRRDFDVIILDRHMFSTMAYAMACDVDFKEVRSWQGDMQLPDLTFFFTIDTDVLAERRAGTKMDAFESKREFIGKIKTAYESIPSKFKEDEGVILPHAMVNANGTIDEVFNGCWSIVVLAMQSLIK